MPPQNAAPNDDRFNRKETAGTPLAAAVEDLAARSGKLLDDMEQMTLGEICELARSTYTELPTFWRVWIDWNQPGQEQPMGDL